MLVCAQRCLKQLACALHPLALRTECCATGAQVRLRFSQPASFLQKSTPQQWAQCTRPHAAQPAHKNSCCHLSKLCALQPLAHSIAQCTPSDKMQDAQATFKQARMTCDAYGRTAVCAPTTGPAHSMLRTACCAASMLRSQHAAQPACCAASTQQQHLPPSCRRVRCTHWPIALRGPHQATTRLLLTLSKHDL
jgi:hypothetical protein